MVEACWWPMTEWIIWLLLVLLGELQTARLSLLQESQGSFGQAMVELCSTKMPQTLVWSGSLLEAEWVEIRCLDGDSHKTFSSFVDNGSYCGSLESEAFEISYVNLSRLTDRCYWDIFSAVLEFCWTITWCCFLGLFSLLQVLFKRFASIQAWVWLVKLDSQKRLT